MIDGLDASMTSADMQQGQIILGGAAGRMFVPGARIDGRGFGVKRFNELTAHELRTQGKLKWEVGGANGGDEPQLAGAFFLGPPLPLEGKLYVLAETKASEIKLCVLDAKTGKLDWSQQLAMVEQGVQNIQQIHCGGSLAAVRVMPTALCCARQPQEQLSRLTLPIGRCAGVISISATGTTCLRTSWSCVVAADGNNGTMVFSR